MTFITSLLIGLISILVFLKADLAGRNRTAAQGISFLIGCLAAIAALTQLFAVIPAGHVGIVDFFGRVSKRTLKPGINPVNPLAKVVKMSTKTQETKETAEAPSKEGLLVTVEVSVLYHLDPDKAAEVYKTIGRDYKNVILIPQFRAVIRNTTASYEARALYTSKRKEMTDAIRQDLSSLVAPRGITIEDTPLRKLQLPPKLQDSIQQKLQAEQESQRMEFVLQKERQEADRKRIEAEGIADFQKIVSQGLTPQYLQWKGVEATEKLAKSQNAKVVIIGAGKGGLPVILQPD